jgi:hypothetical protein
MKLLTHNSQCKLYENCELFRLDLSNLDLIFLQRCHIDLANQLQNLFGFKKVWTSASETINDIGLCTLYKDDIKVNEHRVSVDIQLNDNNQCNAYQEIKYNDLTIINFLGPYLPESSQIPYLINVWSNDFDLAVGDTHFNSNTRYIKELLKNNVRVVNTTNNFISDTMPLTLSWIILDDTKLQMISEDVNFNMNSRICHFPIFFELKKLK